MRAGEVRLGEDAEGAWRGRWEGSRRACRRFAGHPRRPAKSSDLTRYVPHRERATRADQPVALFFEIAFHTGEIERDPGTTKRFFTSPSGRMCLLAPGLAAQPPGE